MTDPSAPTSVYLYYDRVGILIYVGITSRGMSRNSEHNRNKSWWPLVDKQIVEHFGTRVEAHRREIELIQRHLPPFNRQHNPEWSEIKGAYTRFRSAIELDPERVLIDLGRMAPLTCSDRSDDGMVSFRTSLEYAAVAVRLEHTQGSVMHADLGGVGRTASVSVSGPIATISAQVRGGIDYRSARACLVKIARKGTAAYRVKKITISAA